MSLRPCPSCARHVRSSESACPFCETALPEVSASTSTNVGRLGRAALFVAGTALVASAAAGCGPDKPKPGDPNTQKPYGAPPANPVFV
jgi:hypothetical protein